MNTQPAVLESAPAPRSYKILVAVCFDATADAALREGMALAQRDPGAELHIVHVVAASDGAGPRSEFARDELAESLRDRIEAAWQLTRELEVIAHVRPGSAAETILQTAVDIDADVIVVGSHRRTGLSRLMLGSVAEQVLRDSHCPVLIAVPKDYAGTQAAPRIAPPCPECLATRKQSANARFWCERHEKPYLQPHIYVPRNEARASVMPTY